MKYYFFLFLMFSISSFSQTKISGHLKQENEKPVSGVSVIITELNTDNILKYDISNSKGNYSITIKNDSEKLQLIIRSMGYKKIVKIIDNQTQTLNFTLQEEITELKEVIIKSTPITRKGDTLNYSVNAFTKQEDRSIGDVLNNMPGIEVLSDGKILYQGKPINKYYIEGLDLLEGKYNLANKNLPYKEVLKVQVIENHQPIRVLDNLVYSDQAALNIKLKNNYTFTGQVELASGFSPLLWDTNITPMVFSKKRQMLSSYQSNNSGNNIASQLKTLTIDDLLEQFERNDEKRDWLGIQQLAIPNFTEQRWLDNNVHLITTNYLHRLKKDYEIRLNVSYLNDYQQQIGFTNTQFFTINDTIALLEEKYNQIYANNLKTNLTLQKNTEKNFLKNSLIFQGFWDHQQGNIQLNANNISQNLNNQYFKLSNDFKILFPLGKQIATLKSYFGFNKTPQSLVVQPGQFNDLLNNGTPYDEVVQNVDLQTFYTNNSLGFTKGYKAFSFSPKIGVQFEDQNLDSYITTSSFQDLSDSFNNSLDWTRSKLYLSLLTQYKKDKLRFQLATPINLHTYDLEDNGLQLGQNLNRFTFEPRLSVTYDLTSFWRLRASTDLNNQFGTINEIHYAYILQNYRSIQRINTPLPELQNFSYSASIGYRNAIKSFFFNLAYNNTHTENNLLYNNSILENGATELQALQRDNNRRSQNLIARVSKYFVVFNTNITFGANYNTQEFQQILNSEITDITTQSWRLNGKIDTDITNWLNTEIESIFQFSNNEIQGQDNQTIIQQFHKANINIYPKDDHYFAIKTEYITNDLFSETTENFFTDLLYRYSWKKKNIDFEIRVNNLFNTGNYRTINVDNFSYVETNFMLRPRQVLFSVQFAL
ncbi:TonB-dependent receptor [Ascidiimonas aurantiaca]|uniref:TonB-dependent receptor n=1 Tax=Ascidiimonas aurantiaca TaxID=1685432 RepID=UPI0030EB7B9C